jgi:putative PIN family toxin of toxin-antitoxin system
MSYHLSKFTLSIGDSMKVIVDTNVLVGALLSGTGSNRKVIELCFRRKLAPQVTNALYLEYEDVFERDFVLEKSLLTPKERSQFFDDFLSVCRWNELYYTWRPNLVDEGDNHIIELAVAANANYVITNNVRDFKSAELRFDEIVVLTPNELLENLL